MTDYEHSFEVGDWVAKMRLSDADLLTSVYLVEPTLPRVSFLVRKHELTLLQMYDERWVDMPDGPFTVHAGIDHHPTVELRGYGLFPQAVIAAVNFWPGFLEQTRDASTLRLRVGPILSEMSLAGAHAVLLEALRRAQMVAERFAGSWKDE